MIAESRRSTVRQSPAKLRLTYHIDRDCDQKSATAAHFALAK